MGVGIGNCDCRQRGHPAHGRMDSEDLAGAAVWLFLEGDFKVVGSDGTTGKDEVSVWPREDSAEFAEDGKTKAAALMRDKYFY